MTSNAAAALPHAPCAAHPEDAATGTCSRCGRFVCQRDSRTIENGLFCLECAQRPEVDYLEGFRLKYWGRRDVWAWLVGVGGIINVFTAVVMVVAELLPSALAMLLSSAVQLAFFFRVRAARLTLPVLPLVSVAATVAQGGHAGSALGGSFIGLIFSLLILQDTRNQLFFQIQPTPEKLKKAWHLYANNNVARMGFILALVGILAFPIGPIALLCSILGLRNVNPDAHPPIGRKGQAIAGIVLGSIETLALVALVAVSVLSE
jgi:hypothetical protein